ncbi:MAG TPA: MG2 domain-containing protein [Gemmataceae bacterium]|nr:MG2 domain-containing protein [Gemmataceae bacterium]
MPGDHRPGGKFSPARLALGVACVAIVGGAVWLVQRSGQAGAAPPSPAGAAVFQTKDKFLITVALPNPEGQDLRGTLRVELIGPNGRSLARDEKEVHQQDQAASYKFELPVVHAPVDQIKLRCEFNRQRIEVPMNQALLAKAHETTLTSGQEFFAGSTASLRCGVHGVKSLTESVPLPGAEVAIQLRAADGKVFPLYEGKAGPDGVVQAQFKVPAVPPGQYTLAVATRSTLGEEKLERTVRVKSEPKILLTTDKPLYQPGQLIQIRALALSPFDLTPANGNELTFEVEDPKGNKVFKRSRTTSEYGIASVEFQLADEVNLGDYQVRAILGDVTAQKTVTVKKYVLPKFKAEVTADKRFYLPKETIHAELQADYFFGKPVAGARFKVTASTFDVQFREFQTYEGKTDERGHAQFEIKLPDYFVGQPLQKGDALVRLEIKITDTADHTETISKTYPVSEQPIRVSVIPERGLLVPAMENRVFVAAIYPDGSPAAGCTVKLWHDPQPPARPQRVGRGIVPPPAVAAAPAQEAKPAEQPRDRGQPLATIKTNEAGLAEFRLTPKQEQFRLGEWTQRQVEMLGGQIIQVGGQQIVFDVYAEAKDDRGSTATVRAALNSEPFGENVLLRLDKAIYRGGDTLQIDILSSAGLPTVYLDIVKAGQTLLTRWLDVTDGKASHRLDLPAGIFGTLEVHAYQMLADGEIIRDSRVIYVHPREDLKIEVKADKDVYLPGQEGTIRFQVTDAAGKPTAAALGIIVVDEAVYALQEMQPGLEKVYFTLQEELIKPRGQVVYRPSEPLDVLIRQPELPPVKQQIAQVLLAPVQPKPPARWEVDPAVERRRKVEGQIQQLGWALFHYAVNNRQAFLDHDRKTGRWSFQPGILDKAIKAAGLGKEVLTDPFGAKWTLDSLARLEKGFTADRLARAVTLNQMQQLMWAVVNYTNANRAKWFQDGKWTFPETVLADAARQQRLDLRDVWGEPIRLVKRDKKLNNPTGWNQFDYHELVSAGPDRKFDTEDDVKLSDPRMWQLLQAWWAPEGKQLAGGRFGDPRMLRRRGAFPADGMELQLGGGAKFDRAGAAVPPAAPRAALREETKAAERLPPEADAAKGQAPGASPIRIREYFPETLLWQPALITDDKGMATLPIAFADSITTWRLSASASSRGGALGGVSAPLRVFQDFFVDIDLPVSLTQNDEVAFPVAVYNYLKEPQTVKLELEREAWFELVDDAGPTRTLDLKPGEVTAVKFRIRAKRIGHQPLTVKAAGSKMSDAIKRVVEVVPDGARVEKVVTDRLTGKVAQTITIPEHAIPDASKILVKLYPGVFSQVIEGTEGMLRMPFG